MVEKKKAKIIKYYQVVDKITNQTIDNAHDYKHAKEIKKEYEGTLK